MPDYLHYYINIDNVGDILSLVDKHSRTDVVGTAARAVPLVEFHFVDAIGPLTQGKLSNVITQHVKTASSSEKRMLLTWPNTPLSRGSTVVAHANLTLTVDLAHDATVASWDVSCAVTDSSSAIGLWDIAVSLPLSIGASEDGELFYPAGYGYIYNNPVKSTGGAHAKTYPGGETSMQYMALGKDNCIHFHMFVMRQFTIASFYIYIII